MNTDDQILLVVDDKNSILGYAPRKECHTGRGKKHRAFVTLLIDSENKVLLQKRKHRLFDNLWDLTAISHPLHLEEVSKVSKVSKGRDETYQEASDRALKKEMGIGHVPIKKAGAFNYFAQDGANCENEYCAILVGQYDGEFKANPEEVYEIGKMKYKDLVADITLNSQKYTPWAIMACAILEKSLGKSV